MIGRKILPQSSAINLETVCSYGTYFRVRNFKWLFYPEDQHRNLYRCEDLKYHNLKLFLSSITEIIFKEVGSRGFCFQVPLIEKIHHLADKVSRAKQPSAGYSCLTSPATLSVSFFEVQSSWSFTHPVGFPLA
jgi:hypothetical protein